MLDHFFGRENPAEGKHLIRFAFCKTDAVLLEAVDHLKQHLTLQRPSLKEAAS
jgi:hypothetical protein